MKFLSNYNKKITAVQQKLSTQLPLDYPAFDTINLQDPYIGTLDNFLTDSEIDYVLNADFKDLLHPGRVGGVGGKELSEHRTSWNIALPSGTDPVLIQIANKLCSLIKRHPNTMEEMALIRYRPGEYYLPHVDAYDYIYGNITDDLHMSQRVLTVIMYLNDDYLGGHTNFPELDISITPKKGRALLFHNVRENANFANPLSKHQGQEVTQGTKWLLMAMFRLDALDHNRDISAEVTIANQKVEFVAYDQINTNTKNTGKQIP